MRKVLLVAGLVTIVSFFVTMTGTAAAPTRIETVKEKPAKAKPDRCTSARKALTFYRLQRHKWLTLRGVKYEVSLKQPKGCALVRVKATQARRDSIAARQTYKRWNRYHFAWWEWLPDKWQRIGACETGYGKRPGQWTWNSGTFQGAFGFHRTSWDAFVPRATPLAAPYPSEAYLATPRQQYEVALAIYRMYGLSGWGCRNA